MPSALNAHGARTAKLAESNQSHNRAVVLARSPGSVNWQGGLASLQAVTKLVTSGLTGLRTWSAPGQHPVSAQSATGWRAGSRRPGQHASSGRAERRQHAAGMVTGSAQSATDPQAGRQARPHARTQAGRQCGVRAQPGCGWDAGRVDEGGGRRAEGLRTEVASGPPTPWYAGSIVV